jgi:DNA-binding MarR family transcriptional regulator
VAQRRSGDADSDRLDAAEVVDLVLHLVGRIETYFETTWTQFGLAPRQARGLLYLEAPMSMRQLAEALGCDASNVTVLIDRMEARGLVERRAAPTDRRVKQLVLTPEGTRLRERLLAKLFEDLPVLAGLSEPDLRSLRDLLRRGLGTD